MSHTYISFPIKRKTNKNFQEKKKNANFYIIARRQLKLNSRVISLLFSFFLAHSHCLHIHMPSIFIILTEVSMYI